VSEPEFNIDDKGYDPASMPAASLGTMRSIWYRRPWFILTIGVILVVGISVLTDLPHPITRAENTSDQNASIKQINADIAPCVFAVKEAFSFYNEDVAGKLTSSDLTQVPGLLVGDQSACSFASGSIYDLTNNVQITETAAGRKLNGMMPIIVSWTTDSALAAIDSIMFHFKHPTSTSYVRALTISEGQLVKKRSEINLDVLAASKILGTTLKEIKLPVLPHLTGT
jgi:hypothetical protein